MASDQAQAGASAGTSPRKKERSPSFPFIGLPKAMERVGAVYRNARRHEARVADVAAAWGIGAKSSGTQQTIAALLAYGLLEDQGSGESRKLKVTDLAFKALEDQRPGARETALAEAAMKPKLIAEYCLSWEGDKRPADGICISELRMERGFTEEGAKAFLRVYDDTVGFTLPAVRDMKAEDTERAGSAGGEKPGDKKPPLLPPKPARDAGGKVVLMDGERVVFVEETNPQTYVKLVASGDVDATLLEALEDYVKRQKKRLKTGEAAN